MSIVKSSQNSSESINYKSGLLGNAKADYELLLHTLSHEDTRSNIDRHALSLQKWLRTYEEGYILSFINSYG